MIFLLYLQVLLPPYVDRLHLYSPPFLVLHQHYLLHHPQPLLGDLAQPSGSAYNHASSVSDGHQGAELLLFFGSDLLTFSVRHYFTFKHADCLSQELVFSVQRDAIAFIYIVKLLFWHVKAPVTPIFKPQTSFLFVH